MLETRPVLQKSLIGFGAFSFVFLAAMSGTAFMISGGFDMNPPERSQHIGADGYVNLVQDTWSDWGAPQASAATYAPAAYTPAPAPASDTTAFDDANYASEGLEGSGVARTRDRTEEEVARDIDDEYAALQAQEEARRASTEQARRAAEEEASDQQADSTADADAYTKDGQY